MMVIYVLISTYRALAHKHAYILPTQMLDLLLPFFSSSSFLRALLGKTLSLSCSTQVLESLTLLHSRELRIDFTLTDIISMRKKTFSNAEQVIDHSKIKLWIHKLSKNLNTRGKDRENLCFQNNINHCSHTNLWMYFISSKMI